jgi:protein-S-isoprenylcysteine O-methyltransferase Ste14
MSSLSPLRRRAPWVAGALLLALVGVPLLAAGARFGLRNWPFLLGAAAMLLLLAGWLERLWQARALPRQRARSEAQRRFRILRGGKATGSPPELDEDESDPEEPKWLM